MKALKKVGVILLVLVLLTGMGVYKPNILKAASRLETITALELTKDMKLGWNLGNSLDCTNITINNPTVTDYETAWGNPVTTKAMVDQVKKAGFNTIRIPVTWDTKFGPAPNYTINSAWMDRVQEVVNYGIDNGMYVIINLHHENNWLIPNAANQSTNTAILQKVWTQIATRFKNYDEHLIFETMNEPRVVGDPTEWSGGTSQARAIVNAYNLTAVNAIRTTGGNNTYRFILVPTYAASSVTAAVDDLVIPNNDKNCIVSLHMYSPYFFAMDINGTSSWGSDSDKASLDSELDAVYNKFISKGIAVVIGECGSINKSNESSRIALAEYFAKAAKSRKIPLIWWDNNYSVPNQSETFGIFNRSTLTWVFPSIVTALVKGAGDSVTPTPTTTPTPTPTPGTGTMALSTTVNSWNSGYIMNFTISNSSSTAINGWSLTVNKADFNISSIWNAQQTVSGDKIIITPMSYNSTISAGGTVTFSLQGSGTAVTNFSYTLK